MFHLEQIELEKSFMNWKTAVRILLFTLTFPLLPGWFYLYDASDFKSYFTNWGLCFTLMSLVATIVAPYDLKFASKPNKMALQHFLVTISVIMEMVVMPIYWGMLHEGVMRNAGGNQEMVFYQWCAHTIPAMASWGNFFITDFLFYRPYVRVILAIEVFYLSFNFYVVKSSGVPVYWFMAWDDLASSAIMIGLFVCVCFVFVYSLAALSECLNRRRLPVKMLTSAQVKKNEKKKN